MAHRGTTDTTLPRSTLAAPESFGANIEEKPGTTRQRRGFQATFRSLRHRNYRLYFFGQLVSLLGSWMQTTALMWLAYELTRQNKWPAWIAAGQLIPTFLLGAWGGALADRWPKRALLFATQSALLILAVMLAGMVWAGWGGPWELLVISVVTGLVQAVDLPVRLAFVMEMVGRDDLMNAVALNSLLFNIARALGPAAGGWLLMAIGAWPCFLVNGLSYVALLWALVCMNGRDLHRTTAPRTTPGSLLSGVAYIVERPKLALLFLLAGALALCGWPVMSLLPALSAHVLGARASGYSLMVSGTGCGALAGALTVATFGALGRHRQLMSVGVAVIISGLLGLSLVGGLPLAVACCALIGFGLILFFAVSQAVTQLSAAEHNRGLLMGMWAMILSGAVPLGNMLAGPAADHWGERVVLGAEGIGCGAAVVGLLLLLRVWQGAATPVDAREPEPIGTIAGETPLPME
jgi:MFS family permease